MGGLLGPCRGLLRDCAIFGNLWIAFVSSFSENTGSLRINTTKFLSQLYNFRTICRRGRYPKDPRPSSSKLCRDVRMQLIEEIMKKHKMLGKPTSDSEKLRRRKLYEEKQREIRRKKRQRKVIGQQQVT